MTILAAATHEELHNCCVRPQCRRKDLFMKKHFIVMALTLTVIGAGAMPASAASPKTKLTRADAEKIALNKEAGTIKSGELEKEHGRMIYSFDVQTQGDAQTQGGVHEVNVDANTGAVVEDSVESAADVAKEAKADAAKAKKK